MAVTSESTASPGARRALLLVWGLVAVTSGPIIIVAEFADAFGAIGSPNAHPWAEPLALITMLASFAAGIGALAIGGRWWTAPLVASPALFQLLMHGGGNEWAFFALLMTPMLAPLGAVLAVTPRRAPES